MAFTARIAVTVLLTVTLLLHSTTVAAQAPVAGRWVNIGPAPLLGGQIGLVGHERRVTGRVSAMAINPSDDKHWLAGAAVGGVWETRDAGHTWAPLTDDQASLAMGAIAFAPGNTALVYVGTGEAIEQSGVLSGRGMLTLRWEHKKGEWKLAALVSSTTPPRSDCPNVEFEGLGFSGIAVHPKEDGHLVVATQYAGTHSDLHGSTIARDDCKRGIVRYEDGKWRSKPELRGNATDLKVHPQTHRDGRYFDCLYAGLSRNTDVERPELRDFNDKKPMLGLYRRRGPVCGGAEAALDPVLGSPASPGPCLWRSSDTGRWRRINGPWDQAACKQHDWKKYMPSSPEEELDEKWWYTNWDLHLARIKLAIAPHHHNVLYVGISTRSVPAPDAVQKTKDTILLGLWRTSNAWADEPEWVQIPTRATDGGSGALGYCASNPATGSQPQCHWNHALSVDPNNPDVLYAGGIGLWKAEITCDKREPTNPRMLKEKCVRWTEASRTLAPQPPTPRLRRTGIHVDQHAMAWDRHGRRLVVGNDGGVWSSTDAGRTWADHNRGLSVVQFYRGAVAEALDGSGLVILGGTQDNGTARWYGASWEWVLGGDGGSAVIASANPTTHWAVLSQSILFGQRLRRTRDGGKEFMFAHHPLDLPKDSTLKTLLKPLAMCPSNDDILIVGGWGPGPPSATSPETVTQSLWKSDEFFTTAASPTWVRNFTKRSVAVTAVAFAAFDPSCDTYAFGTDSGQVWLTTTGGEKWCPIRPSPPSDQKRYATGLAFAPDRSLYVSFVDTSTKAFGLVAKTETLIPKCVVEATLDLKWKELPLVARAADEREHVNTIAVHPLKPGTVFVGTNAGVWGSTDHGNTWLRHDYDGYGMPNVPVLDIKISPKTGQVVAFTYGRGAFLWQEKGWCHGASSAVVGTNFQSCASQALIRSRLPVPVNDVVSAP